LCDLFPTPHFFTAKYARRLGHYKLNFYARLEFPLAVELYLGTSEAMIFIQTLPELQFSKKNWLTNLRKGSIKTKLISNEI